MSRDSIYGVSDNNNEEQNRDAMYGRLYRETTKDKIETPYMDVSTEK